YRIGNDFLGQRLAPAADHQRMRERPGLARDITDAPDTDAHLLHDLAAHRGFDVVAGLDEAGEHRIHAVPEPRLMREQATVAMLYQHDHRRIEAREMAVPARPAMPPPAAVA